LAKSQTLALVGSESLMGRELRDLLSENSLGQEVRLVAAEREEAGKLTEQAGEPSLLHALDGANLEFARVIFVAGAPESVDKVRELAPGTPLIDLTYAAEDLPHARLRAPMVEPAGYLPAPDTIHVIANAAAIAVALVLTRLHASHRMRRALANIFEPASERGAAGVEELQQQTIGLLSFKGQPKAVFDAQLAFNMLARYGDEAPASLEDAELRIERHLATLLALSGGAPIPSVRLIQAPVFHGYAISLWVEFESNPGVAAIEQALDGDSVDVRTADNEPPNVVAIAGQGGLAIGGVALDRNNPQAAWLWIVADSFRLRAENAITVAQDLL
jgi:aspartate-semialdehyde dehydrogenase